MAQELRRQTALPGGVWIDAEEWSTPVYTAPPGQPRVRVTLDDANAALQADLEEVPLPWNAVPARGTDKHLVLRQPSTDTYWEFWGLTKEADGWHADWGGKMADASSNPGYFTYPFGATASGLPLLGGLMRLNELSAGRIDHALAFTIPEPEAGAFVWPASRTDGTGGGAGAIPEGTRFRIDPALNIDALGLPRVTEMMAKAAQTYGMIVVDRGGAVAFRAEEPWQFGLNPYPALYGGQAPDDLLRRFPWDRLQVVSPSLSSGGTFVVRALGDSIPAGSGLPSEDRAYPVLTVAGLKEQGIVREPIDFANHAVAGALPSKLDKRLRRVEQAEPSLVTVSTGHDLLRARPRCTRSRLCTRERLRSARVAADTRQVLRRLAGRTRADIAVVLHARPSGRARTGVAELNRALRRAATGLPRARVFVVPSPPLSCRRCLTLDEAGHRRVAATLVRRYGRLLAARR